MSYLSLARKYRPQGFADVIAQEHITRTLRNALSSDRLGAAYLFCGVRGTGKTTCARILAKAVNCEKGPTADPCGACASCLEITSGQGMDVLEIDAASNTGVDDIRTLRENIRYLPTRGRKRVYIIDEVHRLTDNAFDALLKTLEEPPAHVLFILATTEPLEVPDTILSRTQRFDFRRVSLDDLAGHLGRIAAAEQIALPTDAAKKIARRAEGSVRDALSLLDHVVAYTGTTVTAAGVSESLGLIETAFVLQFLLAAAKHDAAAALAQVGVLFQQGGKPEDFLTEALELLRLLLHAKVATQTGDQLTAQTEAAELLTLLTPGDMVRYVQVMQETNDAIRRGVDEQLAMDILAIRLAELTSTVSLDRLLDILPAERPETTHHPVARQSAPSAPASPVKPPMAASRPPTTASGGFQRSQPTVRPAPQHQAATPTVTESPDAPTEPWPRLLGAVRRQSPMLSAQLSIADPAWPSPGVLRLYFSPEQLSAYQWLQRSDQAALLSRTMRELFGAEASWSSAMNELTSGDPVNAQTNEAPSEHVQRLLQKVDGEVIKVRKTSL